MPTFGITTGGGSTFPGTNDRAVLSKFTAPESGTVTQINQLFDSSSTAGASFKGLIYAADGAGGIPGTRLGVGSAVTVPAGGGDLASTGLSVAITGGVDYWIGSVISDFQATWSCDPGGVGLSRMEAATYASPAATWTESGTGVATINVYATYSVSVTIGLTGVSGTGQTGFVRAIKNPESSFQSLGFQSNAFAILGGTVGGGGPDVTLSLTGVAATGQIGTLASAISYALSGNQATGSVGNLGDSIAYALTGTGATGQVGTAAPSISYTLSGNQATGAVGTVSYASDITLALTGVSATAAVGSVVPAVSYALSGVNATGNVGAVVANVTYALSGASATGQVGNVSAGNDVVISLTGVQATGAIGLVASALSYSLTGVSGSGQVGSVSAAPSYALSGTQATGAVGNVGDAVSYALTGVSATGQFGSVAVPGDVTRSLTGVSATGQVGSVSAQSGTDFSGGWWMPPRRKKKQPEPEVVEQVEAVEEEPQTAIADALRTAAAKAANQAQKGAEDALVQFVKELEAKRAANEAWLADLARAEAEMRRRREDEETALLFILTARKRKSRQPA